MKKTAKITSSLFDFFPSMDTTMTMVGEETPMQFTVRPHFVHGRFGAQSFALQEGKPGKRHLRILVSRDLANSLAAKAAKITGLKSIVSNVKLAIKGGTADIVLGPEMFDAIREMSVDPSVEVYMAGIKKAFSKSVRITLVVAEDVVLDVRTSDVKRPPTQPVRPPRPVGRPVSRPVVGRPHLRSVPRTDN